MDGVYWTSVSRQGCPTQMKSCFHNSLPFEGKNGLEYPYPLKGGSCVAIIIGFQTQAMQTKVVNCDANLPFACEVTKKDYSPNSKVNSNYDYTDFAIFMIALFKDIVPVSKDICDQPICGAEDKCIIDVYSNTLFQSIEN